MVIVRGYKIGIDAEGIVCSGAYSIFTAKYA